MFFFTAKFNRKFALCGLFVASLIFYSWLNYHYGLILISSIIVNFFISKHIVDSTTLSYRKLFLAAGITFNLGLLSYFKYVDFFIQNLNWLVHSNLQLLYIALPLGISFFTFTQIAFLIDSYRGLIKKYPFLNYALFVTYFPHLIAGPIIHHAEVMPQFEKASIYKLNSKNILIGLAIFSIGLFKKVVLADYLANLVIPVFDIHGTYISTLDAWVGALAYTFELYFDFSGYCDMAIGLSLLFGIKLPVNFYSPYKATNIIEFWRRWNMTLSRFLRNYLYIPLGGNQKGVTRRYINLMITMLLGGLWHGAHWTFVIWGLLHGVYLCINHGWIALKALLGITTKNLFISQLSKIITFIAVVIAWVFFRASDFSTALKIIHAMFPNILNLPSAWHTPCQIKFFSMGKISFFILISFIICWVFPNTYQVFSRFNPALVMNKNAHLKKLVSWAPNLIWNFIIAVLLVFGVIFIQTSSTFLYFQF